MSFKSVGGLLVITKLEASQLSSISKTAQLEIIALEQGQTTGPHFREVFQISQCRPCTVNLVRARSSKVGTAHCFSFSSP
jgi:hypothetical protein